MLQSLGLYGKVTKGMRLLFQCVRFTESREISDKYFVPFPGYE